jgi:hypothetical protein
MILFVEGPRHSGKTFLINQFIENFPNPKIEYYKFYFANHIKSLGLQSLDSDKALHYFSLGNILSILEMNQRPEYKDKIWIFDRAIISAYTWAILRGRLTETDSLIEMKKLMKLDLVRNTKTILIGTAAQTGDSYRVKDLWDGKHSTKEEQALMSKLVKENLNELSDASRKNEIRMMFNRFDGQSVKEFNRYACELLRI